MFFVFSMSDVHRNGSLFPYSVLILLSFLSSYQVEERRDEALRTTTNTLVKLVDRYRFLELLPCSQRAIEPFIDQLTGWGGGVELEQSLLHHHHRSKSKGEAMKSVCDVNGENASLALAAPVVHALRGYVASCNNTAFQLTYLSFLLQTVCYHTCSNRTIRLQYVNIIC